MRNIKKSQEPDSLTEHKKKLHADYDNYADKKTLREYLVKEQRGLCCYCQSRIRPTCEEMKIEHWQCQDNYQHRQLDYRNLLGACLGGHGRTPRDQHCDTRKGNTNIRLSPADPACNVEQLIRFLGDGRVKSDDADIDNELNSILNLNWTRLVNNRKAVLSAFQKALQAGKKLDAAQELPKWDGTYAGDLPEYAQVIVYYLRKKLERSAA
jgi:uncharacterized protein (TIGR02646 family)